jgi:hypothetical protein
VGEKKVLRTEGGKKQKVGRCFEFGSGTRRRPIRQDYAAAKDAEGGIEKNSEVGILKWEVGMQPSTSSDEAKSEIKD